MILDENAPQSLNTLQNPNTPQSPTTMFTCDQCNYESSKKANVERHIETVHVIGKSPNTKPGPGRRPMSPDQWAHKTKVKYAKQRNINH